MTHLSRTSLYRSLIVLAAFAALLLAGCQETGSMIDQPRYNPYAASSIFADGRSARPLQPGTVAYSGQGSPNDPALTGLDETGKSVQGFPSSVTVDAKLLAKGEERFNIYCKPCHGPAGEGNGTVTGFGFGKPPSLLADNAKALVNGDIFQIITNGRGKMWPYGYRVKADERWAVIAYMRALQLKNGAVKSGDLTPADLQQIGGTK
jgi:mono/diheme cytochrome c family protein